jgi:hypothetical protein
LNSQILAIGADDGFVHLIDLRDFEVFDMIDAGGGRGVGLQWLSSDGANSITTLAKDGALMRFTGIPPRF